MQNNLSGPGAFSLGSLATIAAIIIFAQAATLTAVYAGSNKPVAVNDDQGSHLSQLHLKESDLPLTKRVVLGRNKALVIDMPRDLRDVLVSAPEIMDAVVQSSNRVHLIGKKTGQSNAFFFDSNGEQILMLEVIIDEDTAPLDAILNRLLPGANVKSEILNDTVILTGSVRNPIDATRASDIASRFAAVDEAKNLDVRHHNKVINLLSVEGEEQVNLRVVVAEVQRSLLKQFGINLGASINSGNFSTGILTSNSLPLTAAAGLGSLPTAGIGTLAAAAGTAATCSTVGVLCNYNPNASFGNSGVGTTFGVGGTQLSQTLRALERDGLVKTLAEPNLTAISGESAKFLAGGEFPIPVAVNSSGQVTVEYKEYGIGVAFTPTVLSEGRISLKIETEVSELTNNGAVQLNNISVPALKKRLAKSTVELPSGGSMAMAGLLSDDVRQNIDGMPGLKDLPVLGTLFRSRDFIKQETELVVMVTPLLVKAVGRQELASPLDGLGAPSDMKGNFLGQLNSVYGGGSSAPVGDLKGDYGFIVE